MFCESCKIEIPPAWVVVIAKNECPACEGEIMTKETKELLDELRSAMERMPNDPEGLAGWLLSNYQLRKIGDAEPTEFHRQKAQSVNDGVPGNLKIADNAKSVFLQRAGMAKELARRKQLANMAQHINSVGEGEDVEVDMDAVDEFDGMDEYEIMAMMQAQEAGHTSAKKALANNSLLVSGGGPPPTPQEAAAIAQALGTQPQAQQGENLHPALQADRMKRLAQQQGVASGSGNGPFRRSS